MLPRSQVLDLNAVSAEVIASLVSHRQIPPLSQSYPQFDIAKAYRVTSMLRASFEARGETIVGRKIGFTNRQMWAVHGVHAPIWGYCTDKTTFDLATAPA